MSANFYLEYLIYTQGPSLLKHALLGFFMALVSLSPSLPRALSLPSARALTHSQQPYVCAVLHGSQLTFSRTRA